MNRAQRRSRRHTPIPSAEAEGLENFGNFAGWSSSTPGWSVALHDDHGRHVLVALDPRQNGLPEPTARRLLAATALHALAHLGAPDGPDVRRATGPNGAPVMTSRVNGAAVFLAGHGAGSLLSALIRCLKTEPRFRPTRGLEGGSFRAVPTVAHQGALA